MAKKQRTYNRIRRRSRKRGRAARVVVLISAFIFAIFLSLYGLLYVKQWIVKEPVPEGISSSELSGLIEGVDGDIVDALFETGVSSRDIRSKRVFRRERAGLEWNYKDTRIRLPEGVSESKLKSAFVKSLAQENIKQHFKKTDAYLVSEISIDGIPTHRLRFDFYSGGAKGKEPKAAAAAKKAVVSPPAKELAKREIETSAAIESEKELLREKLAAHETKPNVEKPIVKPDEKVSEKKPAVSPPVKEVAKIEIEKRPPIRESERRLFGEKPKIAIIVDDLGLDKHSVNKLIEIPAPLTFSVLPHLPNSTYAADTAHKNGRDVMLHIPMEPKESSGYMSAGDGSLLVGLSKEQILARLENDLSSVPYVKGANNHMGSKFTEDAELMEVVLKELKSQGLFFVDSRTTPKTTGFETAKRLGVKTTQRDFFLDNSRDDAYIKAQINKLVNYSKAHGRAVAICHPYPETIKALTEMIPLIQDEVEIIPASKMVR